MYALNAYIPLFFWLLCIFFPTLHKLLVYGGIV